jgi:hypothetical protein
MSTGRRLPGGREHQVTRLAWDKFRAARRTLDQGGAGFRVRADLEGALMWAMEAWLLRRGIRPDHENGWFSMQAQFLGAAPGALAEALLDCQERLLAFGPGLHRPAHPGGEGGWDSPRWPQASHRCARDVERLLLHILGDEPLPRRA